MASCRDSPCDSASCREHRQEAKSHGRSLHEAIYRAQQSQQEARDRGQSRRKPNTTDSLCRKRKLAVSFIPCVVGLHSFSPFLQRKTFLYLADLHTHVQIFIQRNILYLYLADHHIFPVICTKRNIFEA